MTKRILGKRISLIVSDMAGSTINEGGIIYMSLSNCVNRLGFPATPE